MCSVRVLEGNLHTPILDHLAATVCVNSMRVLQVDANEYKTSCAAHYNQFQASVYHKPASARKGMDGRVELRARGKVPDVKGEDEAATGAWHVYRESAPEGTRVREPWVSEAGGCRLQLRL